MQALPQLDTQATAACIRDSISSEQQTETVEVALLTPPTAVPSLELSEFWKHRGLFLFFVWREVSIRYAQTALGVLWALFQPLLTMIVFSAVFGRLAAIPSDGVPYPVFALAALVPWFYFSTTLSTVSGSLVANRNLLTKIYFPRLVIPFAPILAGLIDLGVASVLLIFTMAYFGIVPSFTALLVLPLAAVVLICSVAGVGCFLAALNVRFRDVKYVVPFLVQIWMFASPIAYSTTLVPERYQLLYSLNPIVGVVDAFRATLLGTAPINWLALAIGGAVSVFLLIGGLLYFKYTERLFADVV